MDPPNLPRSKTGATAPGFTESSGNGVMHNLVVCSANNKSPGDAAMFADFMGISMTLRNLQYNSNGTFISCFPLDEHFDHLGSLNPQLRI
jgi:hypothetical protein